MFTLDGKDGEKFEKAMVMEWSVGSKTSRIGSPFSIHRLNR